MKTSTLNVIGCVLLTWLLTATSLHAQPSMIAGQADGDRMLATYFAQQTKEIADACLSEVQTRDDWMTKREAMRQQLAEMLGLAPMPERTPLHATITRSIEKDDFIVESLHFQSMPGLYVTANLYRPSASSERLPAILYGCGHSKMTKDGTSLGNKTGYQHHGAWFARNGYVCLVLDTIQLGEIEGKHHGTYRLGRWWWNQRGYTPAGVEAWNCIRALDYLQSRDDVDGDRIGMTGRSGGGAYSWWTAALDDRIKVAVPVAGITTLQNHVVDDCVEGHCDCMYMVNHHRWDFAQVAALVAPRPLLISNTDKDSIFPLDGVVELHHKVRRIYKLLDAENQLGLQITEGPHKDTQELQIHAMSWFNRFLKSSNPLITTQATPHFAPEELKVFEKIPDDEITSRIDETFVPEAPLQQLSSWSQADDIAPTLLSQLQRMTFGSWPREQAPKVDLIKTYHEKSPTPDQWQLYHWRYRSESPYELDAYLLVSSLNKQAAKLQVHIADEHTWKRWNVALAAFTNGNGGGEIVSHAPIKQIVGHEPDIAYAIVVPRGIGSTKWNDDEPGATHIRRRFMLLGETVASEQVFDVVQGVQALRQAIQTQQPALPREIKQEIELIGSDEAAFVTLFASLFIPDVRAIRLENLPSDYRSCPDMLNVQRTISLPDALRLAANRVEKLEMSGHAKIITAWQTHLRSTPWACDRIEMNNN